MATIQLACLSYFVQVQEEKENFVVASVYNYVLHKAWN